VAAIGAFLFSLLNGCGLPATVAENGTKLRRHIVNLGIGELVDRHSEIDLRAAAGNELQLGAAIALNKERNIVTSVDLNRLGIALQLQIVASHQLHCATARAQHKAEITAFNNAQRRTLLDD
jgi:hypothetical protein